MINRKSSLIVLGAVGATAVIGTLLWKRYGRQLVRQLGSEQSPVRANQKESIVRWEGEGGNVPDVTVSPAVQPNYDEVAALRA